jgi:iron complex transport system ATP-binding protein
MTPLLEARDLAVSGRLKPTSLTLQPGTVTALIGPNGGGKTSLLRALAGIELSAGRVLVAGEALDRAPPFRRRALLSFLPASRDVTWPITARDVIALGLGSPDPVRVQELIDVLELAALAARSVDRLSTGERARVLLARALAAKPQVLLLDEALSNLDPYWVLRTVEILKSAAVDGAALLVSLHELSFLPHFHRALMIDRGEIQADLSPAEVTSTPAFERAFRVRQAADGWQVSG